MKIFKKYKLEIREFNGSLSVVTQDSQLRILSHFIDFWNKPKDIREDLLPELEKVLNGSFSYTDIGADVIGVAYVEPGITKLIGSELGFSNMELPTVDFKDLIMEWLTFLESQGR